MPQWLERLLHRRTELSVAEAYERWAPNYPPYAHNRLMEMEQHAILQMLPDLQGSTALDLACGSGRYLKILMQRGAALVVGLDVSTAMLARAREFAANLVQADLLRIGLRNGLFHVITCALALGHVEDLRGALIEIGRVLAPRGTVIYSDIHPTGVQLGWKRTFRGQDGREYAARHYSHPFSDHVTACKAAGLRIEEVLEPTIEFDHKWRDRPAVLVIRATKAG